MPPIAQESTKTDKRDRSWVVPLPRMPVTTRMIIFYQGIPINLHVSLLLGGGTTQDKSLQKAPAKKSANPQPQTSLLLSTKIFRRTKKYLPSYKLGVSTKLLGGSPQDLQVVNNHGDRKSPGPGVANPFHTAFLMAYTVHGGYVLTT